MQTQTMNIEKFKDKLSDLAIYIGKSWGFELDYSEESIKQVSDVLEEYNRQYISNNSDIGLEEIAMDFAAYTIKCIEKKYGIGSLALDHPELGKNTLPFTIKGFTIFPYDWCKKNIYNGSRENVWLKYHAFISDLEKK